MDPKQLAERLYPKITSDTATKLKEDPGYLTQNPNMPICQTTVIRLSRVIMKFTIALIFIVLSTGNMALLSKI